ncbi:MAG: DNA repair protein RecO [Armatimonadota bacterium]|nr:DNA repair protein RecO [Armatimonadota bacterium]
MRSVYSTAMKTYVNPGIVIRRIDLGEKDRILTIYTKDYGKLSAVAKGCRRPGSKLAGPSEPFVYSKMMFACGRDLDILTQADVRESFPNIRSCITTTAHAIYLLELIDKFSEDRQPNAELFDILLSGLYMLEGGTDPELTARYFELQLLRTLGYEPHFEACLRCGNLPRSGLVVFSPSLGGVQCQLCGALPSDGMLVPVALISYVKALKTAEPNRIRELQFPAGARRDLARVLKWHIRYRLDSDLKSTAFLRESQSNTAPQVSPR